MTKIQAFVMGHRGAEVAHTLGVARSTLNRSPEEPKEWPKKRYGT